MVCSHGVNLKHKRCDLCEEVAAVQGKVATRKAPIERAEDDQFKAAAPPNDLEYAHAEDAIKIDQNDLDTELIRQPGAFAHAAEQYARACSIRDSVKDQLKSVEARIEMRLRHDADTRAEKITDKSAAAQVQIDPER